MTQTRKLKRSSRVVLTTLTAASSVAVASCGSGEWGDSAPPAEGVVYSTVSECLDANVYEDNECQSAYAQAQADDGDNAPRFEEQALCEQEFGANGCQQRFANGGGGGGGFWVPLLAGFVIGNVIDDIGDSRRRYRYGGLYRNRSSGMWYSGGSNYGPLSRTSGGRYGFDSRALERPTAPARVQSRSSVVSRGGFGGRARSGGG